MSAERHTVALSPATLERAIQGVRVAAAKGGWTLELRPAKRSDEQNDALHGLIDQILKQRPIHNGVKMDKALYKAVFMQALGEEVRFLPTLDGDGMFPLGLSTSALGKQRFSDLIEMILAWCAREGLKVEHFSDEGAGGAEQAPPRAA
ncbi:recombination protein NinB [Phenylobacterium kunshanense]|uniref:NinB family protein n=1 Tax=Phenylobacterium kunshanense TaxID=1445034 RepID=A0A328BP28_9CAUL|nr:recombination protein NinB [Phenylobacterium kunshanense]RAK68777.1 hypothetical protein DJ019_01840 [Phenylobacterium kunshanense]